MTYIRKGRAIDLQSNRRPGGAWPLERESAVEFNAHRDGGIRASLEEDMYESLEEWQGWGGVSRERIVWVGRLDEYDEEPVVARVSLAEAVVGLIKLTWERLWK